MCVKNLWDPREDQTYQSMDFEQLFEPQHFHRLGVIGGYFSTEESRENNPK